MSKTNQLETAFIGHVLGGSTYVAPTQWWVSIHASNPGEDPTLNLAPELGSRIQTTWQVANNQALNQTSLAFNSVPVGEVWIISHVVVWDSPTGGVPLFVGELSTPQTRTEGQSFTIDAQAFSIVES